MPSTNPHLATFFTTPQTLTQQPPPPSTNPHLSTPLNNPQTLTQQPTLPPTKSHLTTPSTLHKLSTKNSFNHPQTFTQQHPPHISHTNTSSIPFTNTLSHTTTPYFPSTIRSHTQPPRVVNRFWKRLLTDRFLFSFSIVFKNDRFFFRKKRFFLNDPLVLNF